MFEDYGKELLRNGIIEAKSGDKDLARRYLERALYASNNSDHDLMAEAWYWLGQVLSDPSEKRSALENALSHNLRHALARRALAVLDGVLKPGEIVDPDRLPPVPEGLREVDARRFMCPKCGGRMLFAPDGQELICEYCRLASTPGRDEAGTRPNPISANEKDFIITMATQRAHGRPLNEQVFKCQGCGAHFILPPLQVSAACAYCGSPHVVALEKSADLLAPDGIIPHAFNQKRASGLLADWMKDKGQIAGATRTRPSLPRGVYLPLWTFDVGGAIDYSAEILEFEGQGFDVGQNKAVQRSDQYPVMMNDLPIPASRKPSAVFIHLIPTFDLSAIQPYDPRYLADWPAEVYDIPMADASLDARSLAYARFKLDLPRLLGSVKLTHTSSANLTIESFKLVLLPVWVAEIFYGGRTRLVLINGQNGVVRGEQAVIVKR